MGHPGVSLLVFISAVQGHVHALGSARGLQASPDNEGSLRVTFCQGMYQDVASELCTKYGRAQLIFCPNAGLESHLSDNPSNELWLMLRL